MAAESSEWNAVCPHSGCRTRFDIDFSIVRNLSTHNSHFDGSDFYIRFQEIACASCYPAVCTTALGFRFVRSRDHKGKICVKWQRQPLKNLECGRTGSHSVSFPPFRHSGKALAVEHGRQSVRCKMDRETSGQVIPDSSVALSFGTPIFVPLDSA